MFSCVHEKGEWAGEKGENEMIEMWSCSWTSDKAFISIKKQNQTQMVLGSFRCLSTMGNIGFNAESHNQAREVKKYLKKGEQSNR